MSECIGQTRENWVAYLLGHARAKGFALVQRQEVADALDTLEMAGMFKECGSHPGMWITPRAGKL